MIIAGVLSTTCTPVHSSIHVYVCTSHQRRLLSKLNSFDQNFMTLGHIVKYHNVFIKFDNDLNRIMPSGVIVLSS